ncbi:MAG: START domain-containing protein [Bacteroidia bacterium]
MANFFVFKTGIHLWAFAFLLLLPVSFVQAQNNWELKKDENGIKVYTKDIPGSDFKEIKTTTSFNASLSSLVALLTDISSHKKWIYRCKESKLIRKVSNSELYYYMETMVPWPASNRDGVLRFKFTQDSITKVVTVSSVNVPDIMPELSGVVRVPKFKASWTFTPKSDGKVEAEYQLNVDPGGSVPAWIINMFAVEGPYESLTNMKKILAENKYESAKFDFIKN